jgi:hypothetical protein
VQSPHLAGPRDVAITDFHVVMLPDGVLEDRSGRRYLTYARNHRITMRSAALFDGAVPGPVRRLAEWALYMLCAGAAAAAICFAFLVPCSCAVPSWTLATSAGPAGRSPLDGSSFAALRAPGMNAFARMP